MECSQKANVRETESRTVFTSVWGWEWKFTVSEHDGSLAEGERLVEESPKTAG